MFSMQFIKKTCCHGIINYYYQKKKINKNRYDFHPIHRRDLELVCKELDLGFTADAIIPNDHRGRVSFLQFQNFFSKLPNSVIFNETSSYESLRRKGNRKYYSYRQINGCTDGFNGRRREKAVFQKS